MKNQEKDIQPIKEPKRLLHEEDTARMERNEVVRSLYEEDTVRTPQVPVNSRSPMVRSCEALGEDLPQSLDIGVLDAQKKSGKGDTLRAYAVNQPRPADAWDSRWAEGETTPLVASQNHQLPQESNAVDAGAKLSQDQQPKPSTPLEQRTLSWGEEATVPMEQWVAWQNEEATVPMEQWVAWQNEEAIVPIEQWVAWQNEEATVPMEQWAAWQNEEATVPMEQWAAWQNEEATVPMERPITDDAVSVRCQKVMGIWQVGVIGNDEETNLLPSHESARFVGNDEETRPLFAHESAHIADNRRDIVRLRQPMSSVEAEQQLPRYCPNCNFELISAGRQSNLLYCFRCHFPISLIGGRWRLQRRLGEGTYGAAYLAENARSKAASVIKILHKDLETRLKIKDKDKREQKIEEFIWRFRQEAKIMRETGRFNHYVPRIYGDGMDENFGYYIAMEYLAGQTLDEIRFAPENRRQILLVFRELCKAMDAIHNCGIVHRDLKPENILLIKKANGSFRLVVFDFGIAKVLGESGLIKTYFPLGTPLYISPEQIRCTYIDRRTDIYAMGIMLYQMLTDKQLFEGTDVESMIIAHIGHPVINMRLRRPDLNIPAGLDDAVCKAVAKNSYERYDSAMDFWNAVAPFCE